MSKLLSISIASYNVEETLGQTLDSLLLEDIVDEIEVLVVDDGSKDGTAKLAQQYQQRFPQSVRYIAKENGGHGSTVNKGIEEATGLYFKVVDGDDWVDATGFRKLLTYIRELQAGQNVLPDIIATPFDSIDYHTGMSIDLTDTKPDDLEYHKTYPFRKVSDHTYIFMHAMTYRTAVLQENPPRLDEHCFYVDVEYVLLPIPYVKNIVFLDHSVYQYRLGSEGQSMNYLNMQKNCADHEKVVNRILTFVDTLQKNGTDQEIIAYVINGAVRLVRVQFRIYLSYKASALHLTQILNLTRRIKRDYPQVYAKNTSKAIRLLSRFPRLMYRPAVWMLRRKLKR